MAIAELGYKIDSSGAVVAAQNLDDMTSSASKAETQSNALAAASKKLETMTGSASREFIRLTASQDSAFNAAVKLSDAQSVLQREFERGSIDAAQMATQLDALKSKYTSSINVIGGTATATRQFGNQMAGSAMHTANLGAQLNDIGVMLAAGQNPLMLAVQQGTQINQVFAQMGGGRNALRGLAAGFASMVNPMSLATIGVIAGGAALVQWGVSAIGAKEDADALADAVGSMEDAVAQFESDADIAMTSLDELREKYGEGAEAVRELYSLMTAVSQQRAFNDLAEAIDIAGSSLSDISDDVASIDGLRSALEDGSLQGANLQVVMDTLQWTTRGLADEFGLSEEQARALSDAMRAIDEAGSVEQSAAAARQLSLAIADAAASGAMLPPEIADAGEAAAEAYRQFTALNQTSEVLRLNIGGVADNTDDAARAARELARAIQSAASFSTDLDAGVRVLQAEISALQAGADASIARTIEGMKINAEAQRQRRIEAGDALVIANAQYALDLDQIANQERLLEIRREMNDAASGGGGRVAREPDEDRSGIQSLIDSLRTEMEIVQQWKLESDLFLASANEMELEAIGGHNEARLRLEEEYQQRLAELRGMGESTNLEIMQDFFGDAAGLMQSGNDKLFKIGQAAAIANAVVNGHSAAVAAWDKGMQAGGPPLAAAFAALSLARTGAQISAIKSASSGGGGGSSGGASAPSAASTQAPQQTRAIIQVQGSDFLTTDVLNSIVKGIQDASDDGVIIEGFTRG